ncbi:TonB-dependent receptor domain-containing protein [Allosphingosinicella deserti]|uniref:TonB-dependent receptor domain-containing protein n=1 Tax=Allosphingosinicella deserti TaxID=2116704 RepID=UPI00130486E3|nr:TonB-dependent receptor [Sphingomonas deserti]
MRRADLLPVLIVPLAAATPADAQESVQINLPGGRLSDALIALAGQTGTSIGTSDTGLSTIRTPPLRGRMTLGAALDRLLAGTGYRYRFAGPRIVRITRARRSERADRRRPSPSPTPARVVLPPRPRPPEREIVITASKMGVALDRFGGTAHSVDLDESDAGRFGARATDAILGRLPMLASTSLGPGRDKIYIRGLADSSFNGPSQSTIGQYLGEARLTFNAPDPNLNLYDIDRVEVLEGPQDTLYGSGSLGGILRLVPNAPDPSRQSASAAAGLLVTRDGGWGNDLAAMVNVPLARDRIGLRLVGYGSTDPGYIDDLQRGRRDVNRTRSYGGRARLRWEAGNDWRIEIGALDQSNVGRDGQYALRGGPPLTRRTNFAQPFNNDYTMGDITVRKQWERTELVSATSFVDHSLASRFDATGFPGTTGPQVYDETVGIRLVSNETRLSRPDRDGLGWLVGWSLLLGENRISRELGPPGAQSAITGVRNETGEAALFGQYGLRLTPRLNLTLGGRLTFASSTGAPIDDPDEEREASRMDVWAAPMGEVTWRPGRRLTLYARYQEGFRAGGLALSPTGAPSTAQRFLSDNLGSFDVGLRYGRRGVDRFSLAAAASTATWENIQADLVDARGLPYTTNIGDGRILSLELDLVWRATPSLSLEMAGFLNDSELTTPDEGVIGIDDDSLPNIARTGARIAARYRTEFTSTASLTLDGSARYVGRSRLGAVAPFDLVQGGFVNARIGARVDLGRLGMTLDVDNIANVRGNRFSYGNPFTLAQGNQITPLRPRTFRIGLDVRF